MKAFKTELVCSCLRCVELVRIDMLEEDGESLQVMAREFENPRSGLLNHVYWDVTTDISDHSDVGPRGTSLVRVYSHVSQGWATRAGANYYLDNRRRVATVQSNQSALGRYQLSPSTRSERSVGFT